MHWNIAETLNHIKYINSCKHNKFHKLTKLNVLMKIVQGPYQAEACVNSQNTISHPIYCTYTEYIALSNINLQILDLEHKVSTCLIHKVQSSLIQWAHK